MFARNQAQWSGNLRNLSASLAVAVGLMAATASHPARAAAITVYKSPWCG